MSLCDVRIGLQDRTERVTKGKYMMTTWYIKQQAEISKKTVPGERRNLIEVVGVFVTRHIGRS